MSTRFYIAWLCFLALAAVLIGGHNIHRWRQCSAAGGEFLRAPLGAYKCIKDAKEIQP